MLCQCLVGLGMNPLPLTELGARQPDLGDYVLLFDREDDAIDTPVEVAADEDGALGRAYGVSRGWLADTDELELGETKVPLSPYVKLVRASRRCAHY